jgi:hypothetical protein
MSARKLPERLFVAYEWTDAAGELDELASLTGEELTRYARESELNFEQDPSGAPVTADDIEALGEWLREQAKP